MEIDDDNNLANCDLIYAVVLPNLQERYDDPNLKKEEYTLDQARKVDFANLKVCMNHNDDEPSVGRTVAYRVNEQPGHAPQAEVLLKLNNKRDVIDNVQRNLLMSGHHRGVSLGHNYSTEYIGGGRHNAAQGVGRVIHKDAYEISTCAEGLRPGSKIYEYMPSRKSLLISTDEAVRSFVDIYNYTRPPAQLIKESAGWRGYIDSLSEEISQRRRHVIEANGYAGILKARGIHAASKDANDVKDSTLDTVPWVMLPFLAQQNVPGASSHNIFDNLWRDAGLTNSNLSDMNTAPSTNTPATLPTTPAATSTTPTTQTQSNVGGDGGSSSATNPARPPTHSVSETVLNTIVPPRGVPDDNKQLSVDEVAAQQAAAIAVMSKNEQAAAQREKMLEERLNALEAEKKARDAEDSKKRKREDEEIVTRQRAEHEAKRAKISAIVNTMMEDFAQANDANDLSVMEQEKARLLELAKTEAGQAELERNGRLFGLMHKAAKNNQDRIKQNEQRTLRAYQLAANSVLSRPPATSFSVSGGIDVRDYETPLVPNGNVPSHNDMLIDPVPDNKRLATPDQGNVRASAYNIFGSVGGGGDSCAGSAANKYSVAEHVPAAGSTPVAKKAEVAAPGVDLNSATWASQVMTDMLTNMGRIPTEQELRVGGVQQKTRYVASANGGQIAQPYLVTRLDQPIRTRGAITMENLDPEGFKWMTDALREYDTGNESFADGLIEAQRNGARNDQLQWINMRPFTGPILEDELQYQESY